MYSCIKLNLYCEGWCHVSQSIKEVIIDNNLAFKELHNTTLLFSAIKNPSNIVIVVISSPQLLAQLETFAQDCHNYQNRVFIVFKDVSLSDNFFTNTCHYTELNILHNFLNSPAVTSLNKPRQPSQLLMKLVQSELQALQIPTKYIGFSYLTQLAVNYLCNTYSPNTYIELFEYVASINLASIDTIERDVRHMILTIWKNNSHFRDTLQQHAPISKSNSKNILGAILIYLKSRI